MTVHELTRDQLNELKQHYICDESYHVSMNDIANADILISDEEIFDEYDGIEFTEDDFLWS